MTTNKKNTSLTIGLFIVGATVLIFTALLFFSGGRLFAQKERVIMYFEGSVQGLQIGAPIKLKGVVLGEISDIQIIFQNGLEQVVTAVSADIVLQRINNQGTKVNKKFITESIEHGLRAQLNYQSLLTGLLYVELDFFPDTPTKLYAIEDDYPEIPTIGTSFQEISKNLQELDLKGLIKNVNKLATQISGVVAAGEIEETLRNFNEATSSIAKAATNLDKQTTQLGSKVDLTLTELHGLIKELNSQAPEMTDSLNKTLKDLQRSMEKFEHAATNIDYIFSEDSALVNQLNSMLVDVSRSAQAFRSLSETLEQQPESILRGKTVITEEE